MDFEDSLKTMADTFRKECLKVLHSERVTIHGANSMLMVLQLAMAEVNKQGMGEFKVALSDVLVAWKYFLLDKLHLPLDNCFRPENYDLILKAYESFLKGSNTVDLVDVHSMYNQLRMDGEAKELFSPAQLFEFLSGNMEDSAPMELSIPSTPSSKGRPSSSQIQMEVRRVFLSYLDLLVNAKNDLALAWVLDIPSRDLGREAFTDLKHAARSSNTSLFLAVTSFVRAIQLGGKGYAPAQSHPLRKHIKGLSGFVQFLDNLEEILGDIPDPSVCGGRLVASVRAALVKGRASGDPVCAAADATATDLKKRISQLHQRRKCSSSNTGISPARFKAHAINHATAIGGRETVKLLMALLDEEALSPPCRNKAHLLSEGHQSILTGAQETCMLTLFRSPEVAVGDSPEPLKDRVQSRQDLLKPAKARLGAIRSQFACTYRDEEPPLNRVLHFPSGSQIPTCLHPAPKRSAPAGQADPEPACAAVTRHLATEGYTTAPRSTDERSAQRGAATLEPRCANGGRNEVSVRGSKDKSGVPSRGKGGKRKQADLDQHGGAENQPPLKKSTSAVPGKMPVKNATKGPSKNKLIAGQGKLTSFFRV